MNDFRILEICKSKGITQADLAAKIGISRVGLSKAINGNTTITTLRKIASALDVEITELFAPKSDFVAFIRYAGEVRAFDNPGDTVDFIRSIPTGEQHK